MVNDWAYREMQHTFMKLLFAILVTVQDPIGGSHFDLLSFEFAFFWYLLCFGFGKGKTYSGKGVKIVRFSERARLYQKLDFRFSRLLLFLNGDHLSGVFFMNRSRHEAFHCLFAQNCKSLLGILLFMESDKSGAPSVAVVLVLNH